ncbi:MAG: LytR/AlgR family response regulator transcription factor [Paraclostridium sp.]|uniref:LytR/AlgR family response regulator transcription factor n=1 Tax=Paraclostridium sp. TaxID=2023273 RepID=UPI003F3EE517
MMKEIKAIIVEPELSAKEELRFIIENNSDIKILRECEDGMEVLEFMQNNTVDLIFLSIKIPKLDGILLANIINKFENKPKIVFTTKYKEYAAKAHSLDIYDYILKPYSEKRLINLFNKLENDYSNYNYHKITEGDDISEKLSLWKNNKIIVVDINDVYYCEAHKKTTYIHTKNDRFEIKEGISHVENMMKNKMIYRCHRSYLVNLGKIKEIIPWINNTYIIKLKNKHELEVSRSKVKQFRKIMHL